MPGERTEITEIATALGMLAPTLESGLAQRPPSLRNVPTGTWTRLVEAHQGAEFEGSFGAAFENGRAFLHSSAGLRGRPPVRVEWKGPHQTSGDDVIPADLRIDHVYLVSCKYLSKVLLNASPARLFDRLLVGDTRGAENWFMAVAPDAFESFYESAAIATEVAGLPRSVHDLTKDQQRQLKVALRHRKLPDSMVAPWSDLCSGVASGSCDRWLEAMAIPKACRPLLFRLLRISHATYFILGADRSNHLRLRVDSMWDWNQTYELKSFDVAPRDAGQPEVTWRAQVRQRLGGQELDINGHVEIRWSHGRFLGVPEAKVYLDTPHLAVAGYHELGRA